MRRQGYNTQLCWPSSSGERRQNKRDAVCPAHRTASAAAAIDGTDRLRKGGEGRGWNGGQGCIVGVDCRQQRRHAVTWAKLFQQHQRGASLQHTAAAAAADALHAHPAAAATKDAAAKRIKSSMHPRTVAAAAPALRARPAAAVRSPAGRCMSRGPAALHPGLPSL